MGVERLLVRPGGGMGVERLLVRLGMAWALKGSW
jgi:hypothetical protein